MPRCHVQRASRNARVQTRQMSAPAGCPCLRRVADTAARGVESLLLSGSRPATLRVQTRNCTKSEQKTRRQCRQIIIIIIIYITVIIHGEITATMSQEMLHKQ